MMAFKAFGLLPVGSASAAGLGVLCRFAVDIVSMCAGGGGVGAVCSSSSSKPVMSWPSSHRSAPTVEKCTNNLQWLLSIYNSNSQYLLKKLRVQFFDQQKKFSNINVHAVVQTLPVRDCCACSRSGALFCAF